MKDTGFGTNEISSFTYLSTYITHSCPFSTYRYSFDINCGRDSLTAMQKTYNKKVPLKAKSFKFLLIVSTKTEVIASTSWTEDNVSFNFIKKYNTSKKHAYHRLIINTHNHQNNKWIWQLDITNKIWIMIIINYSGIFTKSTQRTNL